jgi:hypothetical protein
MQYVIHHEISCLAPCKIKLTKSRIDVLVRHQTWSFTMRLYLWNMSLCVWGLACICMDPCWSLVFLIFGQLSPHYSVMVWDIYRSGMSVYLVKIKKRWCVIGGEVDAKLWCHKLMMPLAEKLADTRGYAWKLFHCGVMVRHPWRVGSGHGRHVSMSGCQERVVLQLKQLCIEKSCLQKIWCLYREIIGLENKI